MFWSSEKEGGCGRAFFKNFPPFLKAMTSVAERLGRASYSGRGATHFVASENKTRKQRSGGIQVLNLRGQRGQRGRELWLRRAKPEPYAYNSTSSASLASENSLQYEKRKDVEKRKKSPEEEKGAELTMAVDHQVDYSQVEILGVATSFSKGVDMLSGALLDMKGKGRPKQSSGVVRFEVTIPRETDSIGWLRRQSKPDTAQDLSFPMLYFSPKSSTFGEGLCSSGIEDEAKEESPEVSNAEVGCMGATCLWKGKSGSPFSEHSFNRINRFLRKDESRIRAFGGIRFDPSKASSAEWEEFGSYQFVIPAVELLTRPSHSVLACTVAWDNLPYRAEGECLHSVENAISNVYSLVSTIKGFKVSSRTTVDADVSGVCEDPAKSEWDSLVNNVLDKLNRKHSGSSSNNSVEMSKVVLARRSNLKCRNSIDPLHLLSCLQDQDRKGFQFCMLLGNDKAFFGSTPERLYARNGNHVVSEAVAATRRTSTDVSVTEDLLTSEKEHNEFVVVRNAVKQALESLCSDVKVEVEKEVLKHVNVQHLYGRLSGRVSKNRNDYHLLSALHPTPAVAGYPCKESVEMLSSLETFDRGFYSGPFGWMSGSCSEFAVAIRSALAQKKGDGSELTMYAGVGIVDGSKPDQEWKELDLKVHQFTNIIEQRNLPLEDFPNTNALASFLVVEELCRLGVKHFCVAPGSRSTPLVLAVANHPRAELVTCIDERSLGFFALGLAKGSKTPAAVITTSGTAVANLLPSVVEASEANVPLVLLTADRPAELHSTCSNQTIDQMHIFGKYPRWFKNFPAYTQDIPLQMILANLSTAWRHATGNAPGPVHLNFEFREPLAPIAQDWNRDILDVRMKAWEKSTRPYTSNIIPSTQTSSILDPKNLDHQLEDFVQMLAKCKSGMIVIGTSSVVSENLALIEVAQKLGWPIVPDVSSGLKLGLSKMDTKADIVYNLDHILFNGDVLPFLQPECIIQIGREPVSKRISSFISRCCLENKSELVMLGNDLRQRDPSHIATYQMVLDPASLSEIVSSWLSDHPEHDISSCKAYTEWLLELDEVVTKSMNCCFQQVDTMTEALIARYVSEMIPKSNALFLGNSMPIRDMEMFFKHRSSNANFNPLAVHSNRGSSGIDGVLSSAAGLAESLGSPVTLIVGDVSFVHDSNGLNFLSGIASSKRAPLTTIVVNNSGGRIFEMLPVARSIESSVLESCFITNPEADISRLCNAYRIPYQSATSRAEMGVALQKAWNSKVHNVVEIFVEPSTSTKFRESVKERIVKDLGGFSSQSLLLDTGLWNGVALVKIDRIVCENFCYPLTKQVTTTSQSTLKEMVKFTIHASHQASGQSTIVTGEVSPLAGLHSESVEEAQNQLICLSDILVGKSMPLSAAFLNGSLEEWFKNIGVNPLTLFPSVRFGLEAALVESVSSLLDHSIWKDSGSPIKSNTLHICGLLSSPDDVSSALEEAERLLQRGYGGMKIKVGRSEVEKDIQVVRAIRERFGPNLVVRCDANRAWTLGEALKFANGVKDCNIEFIEEPVKTLEDLKSFCESSHIPVALDEHLCDALTDAALEDVYVRASEIMNKLSGSLGALVLKPSVLGSVEKFKAVVDISVEVGVKPVVSSTFESSVGLSSLSQLALYADGAYRSKSDSRGPILHGLGTIDWNLHESQEMKLYLDQATFHLGNLEKQAVESQLLSRSSPIYDSGSSSLDYEGTSRNGLMTLHKFVTSAKSSSDEQAQSRASRSAVFLHGFLGNVLDWMPLMSSASSDRDCYAVSLPGHSSGPFQNVDDGPANSFQTTLASTSNALNALLEESSVGKPILVGYSMGARVALDMVVSSPEKYSGLVIISSSPGIKDSVSREGRAIKDILLSAQIREMGFDSFLELWYQQPLFESFKNSPQFTSIVSSRAKVHTNHGVADALSSLSPGLQDSLWPKMQDLSVPLCLVCGEHDPKYVAISKEMCELAKSSPHLDSADIRMHVVPGVGHCVHLEAPQVLSPILANFVSYIDGRQAASPSKGVLEAEK